MSASRSGFKFTGYYFFPVVAIYVENMDIVHPVNTVVPSEVDDLGVNEAASGGDSCTGHVAADFRLDPCQSLCIKVKDIVKLSQLIWFTSKDVDLLVEGNS